MQKREAYFLSYLNTPTVSVQASYETSDSKAISYLNTPTVSVQEYNPIGIEKGEADLNTPTVSVQVIPLTYTSTINSKFKYTNCIGSSIKNPTLSTQDHLFKYTNCIGSSHLQSHYFYTNLYLNTPTVSVQV